ncbi:MAG: hypothetical protein ACXVRS_09685 [Gaiellaceae bacterium]
MLLVVDRSVREAVRFAYVSSRRAVLCGRARPVMAVAAVAAFVSSGCGGGLTATSTPWARVRGCLQRNQSFVVSDADSPDDPPIGTSRAVIIRQGPEDTPLAYLGHNAARANDLMSLEGIRVSNVDGPIHYGFTARADNSTKHYVAACVTNASGR